MRICAFEIKDNQATLCLLEKDRGAFHIPDCRARTLVLDNHSDSEDLINFQKKAAKLFEDYKVTAAVIKSRPLHGKYSGGGISYKIEAALQLIADVKVEIWNSEQVKNSLAYEPLPIKFKETGLKPFQEQAFITGFAFLNSH